MNARGNRCHTVVDAGTAMKRAWTTIASERTRQKREEMAGQISAIPDEQIRDSLRQAMSALFMAIEADLERKFRT